MRTRTRGAGPLGTASREEQETLWTTENCCIRVSRSHDVVADSSENRGGDPREDAIYYPFIPGFFERTQQVKGESRNSLALVIGTVFED